MEPRLRPVLLVEDNEAVAYATTRQIGAGWSVRVAGSIAEVLELLEDGLEPAAAILDFHLPDGNGLALVEPLRELWPGIPIALMTGDGDKKLAHLAYEMDVNYLPKPVFIASLQKFLVSTEEYLLFGRAPTQAQKTFHRLVRGADLSPRMRQALLASLASDTPEEAAARLGISVHTLKCHLRDARARTGFSRVSELANEILRATLTKRNAGW